MSASTSSTDPVASIKLHTLDSLSKGQQTAVFSIPAHDKVTDAVIDATRDTAMFLDQGYYDREQSKVFRKLPVAITVSAALPEPNMVVSRDGYGVPVIVTRDRDGKAHVFLNACMHKGATLTEACEGKKAGRLTCPFHAWSFGLDGKLIGVARGDTFVEFDKAARNLVELPSRETGGIIWAILDKNAAADFSILNDEVIADLDALELDKQHLYGRQTFHLQGNWKQIIEPFLEGYHVQRLHSESVGPLFADVPTIADQLGDHIRQVSGKAQFTPAMLNTEGKYNIHKIVTFAYLLFPNTVVVTSPYYMSVMIVMPNGVGETTVDYHMLTLNPADNPHADKLYRVSYETVLNVFGNEDFAASETCYTGLKSGALDEVGVIYSGLEKCIPMQYATLDKYLEK